MTPAQAIAALDRQIAAHGQPVTIHRDGLDWPSRAIVRGYRTEEFVGGIEQGETRVLLSPSSLAGGPLEVEGPIAGDEITFNGRLRIVRPYEPIRFGGAIVRFEFAVSG